MKLGSLKEGRRARRHPGRGLARPRQGGARHRHRRPCNALEGWGERAPRLNAPSDALNGGAAPTACSTSICRPSPRRRAPTNSSTAAPTCRGARAPRAQRRGAGELYVDPLMYQAVSAGFYGPRDAVKVVSEDYGIDLEAEIVIVTDDVPMAVTPEQAACTSSWSAWSTTSRCAT